MSRRVLNPERNTRSSSERACFRTLSMGNFVESKKPSFVIQGSFLGRFSGFMIESPSMGCFLSNKSVVIFARAG